MTSYNKIKEAIWSMIRALSLGGLLIQIHPKSYLKNNGWFRSFTEKKSINFNGDVIPWWSYGVTSFIQERLQKNMSVLEFGSGSSSIWLASKVLNIITVENDPIWASLIKAKMPKNVTLIELSDPTTLNKCLPTNLYFDILIIDPLAHRINCAKAGIPYLKEDGIVIWDNTDGPDWLEIKSMMSGFGYKEISFSGLAPQEVSEDRTTIFYKQNNVFNI